MSRKTIALILGVVCCVAAAFFGVLLVGWVSVALSALADINSYGWYILLAILLVLFSLIAIAGSIAVALGLFRYAHNSGMPETSSGSASPVYTSGADVVPEEILTDTDDEVTADETVIAVDAEEVAVMETAEPEDKPAGN